MQRNRAKDSRPCPASGSTTSLSLYESNINLRTSLVTISEGVHPSQRLLHPPGARCPGLGGSWARSTGASAPRCSAPQWGVSANAAEAGPCAEPGPRRVVRV